MELVNVVASGTIGRELELRAFCDDISPDNDATYNTRMNALVIKFDSPSATVMMYTSGNIIVAGCENTLSLDRVQEHLQEILSSREIISDEFELGLDINNMVYTADLGRSVDQNKLVSKLGYECTQYEPEQNSFVVYRPSGHSCSVTISSSGKSVISGVESESEANEVFARLQSGVNEKEDN